MAGPTGATAKPSEGLRLPDPEDITPSGGPWTQRLALGRGYTLVDRQVDEAGSKGFYGLEQTLQKDGATLGSWRVSGGGIYHRLIGFRYGDTALAASQLGTSNGMGVQSWRLTAFRLVDKAKYTPPVAWLVHDFGPDAVAIDHDQLQILATSWVKPAFGPARASLHFVGTWYALDGDRLAPLGPTLARPYLFSFERERDGGSLAEFCRPVYWLRPGQGKPYPGGDPRLGPETAPRVSGHVTAINPEDDGLAVDFTTARGAPRKFWLRGVGARPAGREVIDLLGEGGRLLPEGYQPARAANWANQPATLATYHHTRVLWLGKPGR